MRRRLLGVLYFARIGAMLAAIPLAGAIGRLVQLGTG